MRLFLVFSLLLRLMLVPEVQAQQTTAPSATLKTSTAAFPINEYFTISFTLRGAPLERYSAFPDVEGFKKSGKSSTTTTRIVEGKTFSELTITQRYAAYAEGTYVVKPFTMKINGLTVESGGVTLKVGPQPQAVPPPAAAPLQGIGLLDQLFGKPKPQEYVEPQDQAFLALVPDKQRVFVGAGVHVGLYFYLTPQDQAVLNFHNFAGQLPGIIRQLRQRSVWEEGFDEQEVLPENVVVGGKPFLRYRLWEAELYPLNTQPLNFPAVELQMLKYRVAKKPEAGLDNRMEGYKTYRSAAVTVAVLPLPPHPLRDQVPVGNYELTEAIDRTTFRTGQAFTYTFAVEGEGNLAAVQLVAPPPGPAAEVYGPEVQQSLTRENGRVGGRKSFRFRVVARRPGPLALDTLFQMVYFNPVQARYDTLRAGLSPVVRGEQQVLTQLRAQPDDPFYRDALSEAEATAQPRNLYHDVRRYANLVVAVLLVIAGTGWWKARR
ncbi:BatD family protein [Hymenobacter sp. UYP22]|uniref:BatD family protein n=1 Tax=Hymenobacter sp. UYP22 TaxID=3156348 RepID=UPI003398F758